MNRNLGSLECLSLTVGSPTSRNHMVGRDASGTRSGICIPMIHNQRLDNSGYELASQFAYIPTNRNPSGHRAPKMAQW
jgi:hypothetical protein